MGKHTLLILGLVLVVFLIIVWACGLVGNVLGPVGENIALGIIAVILLIGFIKSKREENEENEQKENIKGEKNN